MEDAFETLGRDLARCALMAPARCPRALVTSRCNGDPDGTGMRWGHYEARPLGNGQWRVSFEADMPDTPAPGPGEWRRSISIPVRAATDAPTALSMLLQVEASLLMARGRFTRPESLRTYLLSREPSPWPLRRDRELICAVAEEALRYEEKLARARAGAKGPVISPDFRR
jgi:hypothetical protein